MGDGCGLVSIAPVESLITSGRIGQSVWCSRMRIRPLTSYRQTGERTDRDAKAPFETTGSTPPSRRRAAIALVVALGFVGIVDVAGAATRKPVKSTSTATFCAAAKTWLAYEKETLESGPYDAALVLGTYDVLKPFRDLAAGFE